VEEEELELVYSTFVGMRNNGARWLGNNEKYGPAPQS
jgi:hypothetical protein